MGKKVNETRVNERIRTRSVRLIAVDGTQMGVLPINEALEAARRDGLDLVEVAPNSDPPVCRIMDYGKYKYQASKKAQEAKKKGRTIQVKEIRLRPHTEEHDLGFKVKNLKKFLDKKDRVKVTVLFKGREKANMNSGFDILKKVADEVEEIGTVEQPPTREGWRMTMVIAPK